MLCGASSLCIYFSGVATFFFRVCFASGEDKFFDELSMDLTNDGEARRDALVHAHDVVALPLA